MNDKNCEKGKCCNRIRAYREYKGVSQRWPAGKVGCSNTISEIEKGKRAPNVYLALRITLALDATVEKLWMEGNDDRCENGAVVRTAFITSYGDGVVTRTAPDLGRKIADAVARLKSEKTTSKPKYAYPDYVITAAMLQRYSKYGVDFAIRCDECVPISALDAQRQAGKTIYGSGLLLSRKAAAEKAAAIIWELSDREMGIISGVEK